MSPWSRPTVTSLSHTLGPLESVGPQNLPGMSMTLLCPCVQECTLTLEVRLRHTLPQSRRVSVGMGWALLARITRGPGPCLVLLGLVQQWVLVLAEAQDDIDAVDAATHRCPPAFHHLVEVGCGQAAVVHHAHGIQGQMHPRNSKSLASGRKMQEQHCAGKELKKASTPGSNVECQLWQEGKRTAHSGTDWG